MKYAEKFVRDNLVVLCQLMLDRQNGGVYPSPVFDKLSALLQKQGIGANQARLVGASMIKDAAMQLVVQQPKEKQS